MADRIAVMSAGRLQQVAAPRAVYEAPANLFVASFLGAPPINLIELAREGSELVAPTVRIAAPRADMPERVTIGFRPEHVHLGGTGEIVLDARVLDVEPLGAETHVHLEAGAISLRARAPGFDAPPRGATIRAAIEPRRLLWFDARSGERIALSEARP